jgi:hypothetical protein
MASLPRPLQQIVDGLRPNRLVPGPVIQLYAVATAAALLAAWQLGAGVLPGPVEVAAALGRLWRPAWR